MDASLTSRILQMNLRERIEHAMHLRDVNQTQLAKLVGVSPQAAQKWLSKGSDGTTPRMPKIKKIAEVLAISEAWLLTGQGSPDSDEDLRQDVLNKINIELQKHDLKSLQDFLVDAEKRTAS